MLAVLAKSCGCRTAGELVGASQSGAGGWLAPWSALRLAGFWWNSVLGLWLEFGCCSCRGLLVGDRYAALPGFGKSIQCPAVRYWNGIPPSFPSSFVSLLVFTNRRVKSFAILCPVCGGVPSPLARDLLESVRSRQGKSG